MLRELFSDAEGTVAGASGSLSLCNPGLVVTYPEMVILTHSTLLDERTVIRGDVSVMGVLL